MSQRHTLSPAEIIDLLSREYGRPPSRLRRDPTAELVLTVLSQNTSDTNSGRAFARLVDAFPDWQAVLTADVRRLEEAIQPGGLARTKAPRIQAILAEVRRSRGSFDLSFLADLPLEEARAWLRGLPGVGPKTAACVLLFSLGRPALPVDTHVHRVAQRLGLVPGKASAEKAHVLLEARLEPDEVYPFHIALVTHGRRTCQAQRPRCPSCVLRHGCPSAARFYPATGDPTAARR
jgi:endonuclease-3